ncbi:SDR family oxidoreductase [Actinokineospora enzanensis]|uniref:SDR family oxidoreductase n=1 Tax=Actinokineospora enzanensis TaxID=155975 RepID=UPI00037768A9|nr:SDR family oxidoreductase [Actinokineospora enzanensis]
MSSLEPLSGKLALVTGGSRGLGRAIVHRLCRAGCDVLVNYRNDDSAAGATVDALADAPGVATPVKGDIRDAGTLAMIGELARASHGGLDIVVHNAASWRPMSALAVDHTAFWRELSLALDPLLLGAPLFAELMAGRAGRIVAISGNGAHSVIPDYVATGVGKAALESLVRYLAAEFAGRGVAVTAVSTGMLDKGEHNHSPELAAMLGGRTPAGRLTKPDDVADAVALLCSREAHWIHGQVVTADGGLGLRA